MPFFNNKYAFGLPKGTIRALLALILVVAVVGVCFVTKEKDYVMALLSMASFAIGHYFNKKDESEPPEPTP